MIKTTGFSLAILFSALAFLAACGGGGGGGGSAPVVDVPLEPDPDPEPVEPETSCEVLTSTSLVSDLSGGDPEYDRAYWAEQVRAIMTQHRVEPDELYSEIPDIDQCVAGAVRDETQQQVLTFINKARKLHGLAALEHRPEYDVETAAAALMIAAAGNFYSTDSSYYERCVTAEAEAGLDSSALLWGGSKFADLLSDIVFDTLNPVHSLIHWLRTYEIPELLITPVPPIDPDFIRPRLLNPALAATSYGQVGPAAALSYKDSAELTIYPSLIDPEIEFIAYPFDRFPYFMAPEYSWDIRLRKAVDMSGAVVCVTNSNTGELVPVYNQRTMNTSGYLRWDVYGQKDTHYLVSIHNISDSESSESYTVAYPVFIDYSDIAYIDAPLEDSDIQTGSKLVGNLSSLDDVDTFQVTLSGNVDLESTQVGGENIEIAVFSIEGELQGVSELDTPEELIDDTIEGPRSLQLQGLPTATYSVRVSFPQHPYNLENEDEQTDYTIEITSE